MKIKMCQNSSKSSPLQAELYEVSACFRAFPGPQLYLNLPDCRLQAHLSLTGRLLDVDVTHIRSSDLFLQNLVRFYYVVNLSA